MDEDQKPNTNLYSGRTRSSKAALVASHATKSEAKVKMYEAPAKLPSRKRKLDDATTIQPSAPSMKQLEKPTAPSKPSHPKKPRGVNATPLYNAHKGDDNALQTTSPIKKPRTETTSPSKPSDGEKRPRVFRKKAPQSYLEKLERATSQRMFVIDRTRGGTDDIPEETIDMAGTTGNIYSITISQMPKCTCPDNQKGNQCKHIVYVLHNVLKAPEHLQYQLAFLSSELREIFAHAPLPVIEADTSSSNNRKEISGDCPICFTEFEPETEEIVWCKAACGNNIHKGCFEQWAMSQRGKEVKCVYCRTTWQGDPESLARIKTSGKMNDEGYINVSDQLGLSGERDYSSYHRPWVRRQFGWGY